MRLSFTSGVPGRPSSSILTEIERQRQSIARLESQLQSALLIQDRSESAEVFGEFVRSLLRSPEWGYSRLRDGYMPAEHLFGVLLDQNLIEPRVEVSRFERSLPDLSFTDTCTEIGALLRMHCCRNEPRSFDALLAVLRKASRSHPLEDVRELCEAAESYIRENRGIVNLDLFREPIEQIGPLLVDMHRIDGIAVALAGVYFMKQRPAEGAVPFTRELCGRVYETAARSPSSERLRVHANTRLMGIMTSHFKDIPHDPLARKAIRASIEEAYPSRVAAKQSATTAAATALPRAAD